jgi:hypothetical protein
LLIGKPFPGRTAVPRVLAGKKKNATGVAEVNFERPLRVPADPAAAALGELLQAIADQKGMWRGFALHIALGDLRLPNVGYVAVPIALTASKETDVPAAFAISFQSSSLPTAFPMFAGRMSVEPRAGIGESTIHLRGAYELPMQFFGKLLDASLTPHLARRSLENFIDEMAAACEARVNQQEAEFARYHFYARNLQ